MTAFGATLKRIRERRRISQSRLAVVANLDRSYVGRLEHGDRLPSQKAAAALALALETTDEERAALMASAGFLIKANMSLLDADCVALAKLLTTVNPERGALIRATVRNLIAMNAGGMG